MRRNIKNGVANTSLVSNLNAQYWNNVLMSDTQLPITYTIDAREQSNEIYYPIILTDDKLGFIFRFCICSDYTDTGNSERIIFDAGAAGWYGYPPYFKLIDFRRSHVDNNLKNIGSIGYASQRFAWWVIWVKGGSKYYITSNYAIFTPKLYTEDYTANTASGGVTSITTITTGPEIYGSDRNVSIRLLWQNDGSVNSNQIPVMSDINSLSSRITTLENFVDQFSANDNITYAIKNRKPEEICGADEAIVVCTNENAVSLALKSLESGRLEIDETTDPEIVEEMKNLLGDELFNELAVQSVSTLELQPQLSEKEQLKQAIENYYRQKEMLSIDKMMPDILSEDKLIEEK